MVDCYDLNELLDSVLPSWQEPTFHSNSFNRFIICSSVTVIMLNHLFKHNQIESAKMLLNLQAEFTTVFLGIRKIRPPKKREKESLESKNKAAPDNISHAEFTTVFLNWA